MGSGTETSYAAHVIYYNYTSDEVMSKESEYCYASVPDQL